MDPEGFGRCAQDGAALLVGLAIPKESTRSHHLGSGSNRRVTLASKSFSFTQTLVGKKEPQATKPQGRKPER